MVKILFVEDDLPLALGIEYTLNQEGFNVVHSKNLKEARENFKKEKFDMILLDVMLPDGTGYDFCKEVRSESDIPLIFMTACDEEVNVVLGLDLGGDDYVTKPIRVKELISRINAVLRRKENILNKNLQENKEERKITTGNIVIEPLKYKVYKNNEIVELTSVEYKLLLILIESKGNVLERNQLLGKLWDVDGNFVDGNALNVYIKRLREKVEDNPKSPSYIETLRGVGYRWTPQVKGV